MTHRRIKTLDDGTRWYECGHGYVPLSADQRKYGVRKPDDPRAVRFGGRWFLPLELVDDAQRSMPATRPDDQILEHSRRCRCEVCRRPEAQALYRRRVHGIRR